MVKKGQITIISSFIVLASLIFPVSAPLARADVLPAPVNVKAQANSAQKAVVVSWERPPDISAPFIYYIELLNNLDVVWKWVDVNQDDTLYIFNNLPLGYYTAKVHIKKNSILGPAGESSFESNGHISVKPESFNGFSDVDNYTEELKNALDWAAFYKIARGQGGEFSPNNSVTRQEMSSFLYRFYGSPPIVNQAINFVDVTNIEHRVAIDWLSSEGITTGYDCTAKGKPNAKCGSANDKYFLPDNEVKRGQLAQFMYKLIKQPHISQDEINYYISMFGDSSTITADQSAAIAWLKKEGITKGNDDGTFGANNPVTRIQTTLFLQRLSLKLGTSAFLKEAQYTRLPDFEENSEEEIDGEPNFLGTSFLRKDISEINFINTLPKGGSSECVNTESVSEEIFQGAILACLDTNDSKLTVGTYGGASANIYNSNYLFGGLINMDAVTINMANLYSSEVKQTELMFSRTELNAIAFPEKFASRTQNMREMFLCTHLRGNINWTLTDFLIKENPKLPIVDNIFKCMSWGYKPFNLFVKNEVYREMLIAQGTYGPPLCIRAVARRTEDQFSENDLLCPIP
ncbi:MAG: S-layer homology domain-containing protein [Bifidobacteriaceae bacterium]|jgi:hypothetical protein|nr:S-layer homology domain-containing protein [Bifidobacteriaceae bacterium]